MVWVNFSYKGFDVFIIQPSGKKVNMNAYISILKDKLLISMNENNIIVFKQDMAHCNTARKTEKWFFG